VWGLPLDNRWNIGMVEKWNIGYKKRSTAGGLISDQCHLFKNRPHTAKSGIPAFHYSSTPWHSITAIHRADLAQKPRFLKLEKFSRENMQKNKFISNSFKILPNFLLFFYRFIDIL
jgi:hypothetical protein